MLVWSSPDTAEKRHLDFFRAQLVSISDWLEILAFLTVFFLYVYILFSVNYAFKRQKCILSLFKHVHRPGVGQDEEASPGSSVS